MTEPLRFTVLGRPEPQGSTRVMPIRAAGKPTRYTTTTDNVKLRPWRALVASAAEEALDEAGGSLIVSAPVGIELTYYFARPKGHYGSGRNSDLVRKSAPPLPAGRPDLDKLVRAVLDALTGLAFRDDGQVVAIMAVKQYGDPERLRAVVRVL